MYFAVLGRWIDHTHWPDRFTDGPDTNIYLLDVTGLINILLYYY
jgi:hypothetical protein